MTNLCSSLESEHRLIEQVLSALEREADLIDAGNAVDADFFTKALAFIREFADGLHHQKEEQTLFPKLVEVGVPREGGPVGVMLADHENGRSFVRAMAASLEAAASGDTRARSALLAAARSYVDLLRAHIMKEDGVLFPMAEQLLDSSQQDEMQSRFAEAERVNPDRDHGHRLWVESLRTG